MAEPFVAKVAFVSRPAASVLAFLVLCAGPGRAEAGIGSWGDAVAYVGDGGHEAWMIGQSQDVGYKYSHVAMLGLNLWAWDGTYCVYQRFEKKYVPISAAEAARLLHKDERELQPPFEYRCPLGLFIFGPLIVLGLVVRYRETHPKREGDAPADESEKEKGEEKGPD